MPADPYAGLVLDYLQRLVPSYASLLLTQEVDVSDGHDSLTSDDHAVYDVVTRDTSAERVSAATESAFFRLIPIDITEV